MEEDLLVQEKIARFEQAFAGFPSGTDSWITTLPNRYKGLVKDRYGTTDTALFVADGVSGESDEYRSDVTAQRIINQVQQEIINYQQSLPYDRSPAEISNDILHILQSTSGSLRGMPETTIAFAAQLPTEEGDHLFIAAMGDSPVYVIYTDEDTGEWNVSLQTTPDNESRSLPPTIRTLVNYCLRNIPLDESNPAYLEAVRTYHSLWEKYKREEDNYEAPPDPAVLKSISQNPLEYPELGYNPLEYYYKMKNVVAGATFGLWTQDHVHSIPVTPDLVGYFVSSDFIGVLTDQELSDAVQSAQEQCTGLPKNQQTKRMCSRVINERIVNTMFQKVLRLQKDNIILDDDLTLLTRTITNDFSTDKQEDDTIDALRSKRPARSLLSWLAGKMKKR